MYAGNVHYPELAGEMKGDYVEGFWIIGIVINVLLTGLAIYWIIGQVKAGRSRPAAKIEDRDEGGSES